MNFVNFIKCLWSGIYWDCFTMSVYGHFRSSCYHPRYMIWWNSSTVKYTCHQTRLNKEVKIMNVWWKESERGQWFKGFYSMYSKKILFSCQPHFFLSMTIELQFRMLASNEIFLRQRYMWWISGFRILCVWHTNLYALQKHTKMSCRLLSAHASISYTWI